MSELFTVHTPPAALALFNTHFHPKPRTERVPVHAALDRILAEPLVSPQDLPNFRRSTMDGYAVYA
jgi:molybdopterin molybdotransferase